MATVSPPPLSVPELGQLTLRGVTWEVYCQLRDEEANDSIRMTYLDGELTLMSPELEHEGHGHLLGSIVRVMVEVVGLELRSAGSTTLRRQTLPPLGAGKEPDLAFFIGADERRMRGRWTLDLNVDPPPTLAIEIDHSRNSGISFPVYARLGVPEVWRFRMRDRTFWVGRLEGTAYQEVGRSGVLPRLTPTLIQESMARFAVGDIGAIAWTTWLRAWARGRPEPGGEA